MTGALQIACAPLISLLEVLPDSGCLVGTGGEILHANARMVAELGPWEGRSCSEYLSGLEIPCGGCMERSGAQEAGPVELELTCPETGASRQLTCAPVRGAGELQVRALILSEACEEPQVQAALLRAREELQQLASYLQEVREEERLRVTQALESTVGQLLASLHIDAAWLRRRAETLGSAGEDLVLRAESMTRTILAATERVRQLGGSLRPGHLDDLGLQDAIEWLVKEFQRRTGVSCSVLPLDRAVEVHPEVATALYRILEEALRNCAGRGGVTSLVVKLEAQDEGLTLTVHDDARMKNRQPTGAIRLVSMRERALALGGRLWVRDVPGEGTRVEAWVPLDAQVEES